MKKRNKKLQQIIDTGRHLLWKYGFQKVTVEEICKEANVSKMTFYKYFENKLYLARIILEDVMEDGFVKYRHVMDSNMPFTSKIKAFVEIKVEGTNDISREFLNDIYAGDVPELTEMIQSYTVKNMQIIRNDFLKFQQEGIIRQDMRIDFLMYMLNKLIELAIDENLGKIYNNPQQQIVEITNFFFYGVLPVEEHQSYR